MNRLNRDTRVSILNALLEGSSQRACERMFGVSNNTVAKLFRDAGDMAIAKSKEIRDLTCERIQADELYAFVGARQRNVHRMKNPRPGSGTIWRYLAQDAETKLVIDYRLGDRRVYDATEFMRSVASKLRRNKHGSFAVRPTIITDGLGSYKEACAIAFGTDADVGMMIKKYENLGDDGEPRPNSRYIGSDRVPIIGSPKRKDISTAYVERLNLNVRMDNRRYGRRTNAFSKTLLNHERHIALWMMHTNYCRIPRPMRPRTADIIDGNGGWIKRVPPAMAAGLTDRPWTIDDLITLTDEFIANRLAASLAKEHPAEPEGVPTHWVYWSSIHYNAKVHAASCSSCRNGDGKRGGGGRAGSWHPFHSLEAALNAAKGFEPDRHGLCNLCLGSYRTQGGYRGPRR